LDFLAIQYFLAQPFQNFIGVFTEFATRRYLNAPSQLPPLLEAFEIFAGEEK
jgi:hypothetical protein